MTELEKGPTGRRRGRGARERILSASQQPFWHSAAGLNALPAPQAAVVLNGLSPRPWLQEFEADTYAVRER